MKDKLDNILAETDCLSEETLYAFVDNKLSPKERHAVEMHLVDCELCSDALEGMALLQNKDKSRQIIMNLKDKISPETLPEIKKSSWLNYRWSIAAALAFLIIAGSVFIVLYNPGKDQKDTQLADQFESKNNHSGPIAADSIAAEKPTLSNPVINELKPADEQNNNEKFDKANQNKKTENDIPIYRNNNTGGYLANPNPQYKTRAADIEQSIPPDQSTLDETVIQAPVASPPTKNIQQNGVTISTQSSSGLPSVSGSWSSNADLQLAAPVNKMEVAKLKKKNTDTKAAPVPPAKPNAALKSKETTAAKKAAKAEAKQSDSPAFFSLLDNDKNTTHPDLQATIDSAMRKYDLKDYKAAITLFQTILRKDPNNYNALFCSGVSYYFTDKPDSAILHLNQVLADNKGDKYEASLYYKALALIKQNNKKAAKKLLKSVIALQGSWMQLAQDSLNSIDK